MNSNSSNYLKFFNPRISLGDFYYAIPIAGSFNAQSRSEMFGISRLNLIMVYKMYSIRI